MENIKSAVFTVVSGDLRLFQGTFPECMEWIRANRERYPDACPVLPEDLAKLIPTGEGQDEQ